MRKLKNRIAFDPVTSVPGIYPEKIIKDLHKYLDTWFIVSLWFTQSNLNV